MGVRSGRILPQEVEVTTWPLFACVVPLSQARNKDISYPLWDIMYLRKYIKKPKPIETP